MDGVIYRDGSCRRRISNFMTGAEYCFLYEKSCLMTTLFSAPVRVPGGLASSPFCVA